MTEKASLVVLLQVLCKAEKDCIFQKFRNSQNFLTISNDDSLTNGCFKEDNGRLTKHPTPSSCLRRYPLDIMQLCI